MEEKVLNKIREEYNQNIQILQEYNVITKRISELAQNESVKEYLKLINILDGHQGKKFDECSESNLINVSFSKVIHEIK